MFGLRQKTHANRKIVKKRNVELKKTENKNRFEGFTNDDEENRKDEEEKEKCEDEKVECKMNINDCEERSDNDKVRKRKEDGEGGFKHELKKSKEKERKLKKK